MKTIKTFKEDLSNSEEIIFQNTPIEDKIIKIFDITKQEFYSWTDPIRKGDYLFYQNLLNGFLIKNNFSNLEKGKIIKTMLNDFRHNGKTFMKLEWCVKVSIDPVSFNDNKKRIYFGNDEYSPFLFYKETGKYAIDFIKYLKNQ